MAPNLRYWGLTTLLCACFCNVSKPTNLHLLSPTLMSHCRHIQMPPCLPPQPNFKFTLEWGLLKHLIPDVTQISLTIINPIPLLVRCKSLCAWIHIIHYCHMNNEWTRLPSCFYLVFYYIHSHIHAEATLEPAVCQLMIWLQLIINPHNIWVIDQIAL